LKGQHHNPRNDYCDAYGCACGFEPDWLVAGLLAVYGLSQGKLWAGWTHLFLLTTVLTSLTGYLFPVEHVLPSHIIGAISLVVLAIAMVALYGQNERAARVELVPVPRRARTSVRATINQIVCLAWTQGSQRVLAHAHRRKP